MKRTITTCDHCRQEIEDERLPIQPRFDLWSESAMPSGMPIRTHYHFCNQSCLFGWLVAVGYKPSDTAA